MQSSRGILMLFVVAACGGGAPEDIQRICEAATECGSIPASGTQSCIDELDAVTPDSASRAAGECADCLESTSCGEIADGACKATCQPLLDTVNSVPGTVSGSCTSSTTRNYAIKSNLGNLLLQFDCLPNVQIIPGPYVDTVGTTLPCGKFSTSDGTECPTANGNVTIEERDGRRWVTGSCSCSGQTLTFEVPYHIAF